LVNHLSGKTQKYIKMVFRNLTELNLVKRELLPIVKKNQEEREIQDAYEGWHDAGDFAR
jgi:DNA polymerase epsilon subunit 1